MVLTACNGRHFGVPPSSPAGPPATYTPTQTQSATSAETPSSSPAATRTSTPMVVFSSTSTPTTSPTPTSTTTQTFTATLSPTTVATALVGAPDFTFTAGVTTLSPGIYYFSCVHIGGSAVVTIAGGVTIMTQCFTLDASATITGVGTGYCGDGYYINGCSLGPGEGHGASAWDIGTYLACGGGHGGPGQIQCDYQSPRLCAFGGSANDDPIHPCLMGSGGSLADDIGPILHESSGGGLLKVVVLDPVANALVPATVDGTIDMSGFIGFGQPYHHAGGGAGGTILIEASRINGSGTLRAEGGNAYIASAGGGGGIISLIENRTAFDGTLSVIGGDSGYPGIVNFSPSPATGY